MKPRESALSRLVAIHLAATEYDRCTEIFRSLSPAQWTAATGWTSRPPPVRRRG